MDAADVADAPVHLDQFRAVDGAGRPPAYTPRRGGSRRRSSATPAARPSTFGSCAAAASRHARDLARPPFLGHMTGLPSVDTESIGAGGGSIAWIDAGGLLHVGPSSAGADPGPVAYGRAARGRP